MCGSSPRSPPPSCSPARAERPPIERDRRRELGLRGEQLAAEHLARRGLEVLARNARTRHGEIDIVAREGRVLVFVEVKTRRMRPGAGELQPLAGVHPRQRVRLRRLAVAWLAERRRKAERGAGFASIRFDAIGVVLDRRMRLMRLEHLEDAW